VLPKRISTVNPQLKKRGINRGEDLLAEVFIVNERITKIKAMIKKVIATLVDGKFICWAGVIGLADISNAFMAVLCVIQYQVDRQRNKIPYQRQKWFVIICINLHPHAALW
jgi:hypothetical protein